MGDRGSLQCGSCCSSKAVLRTVLVFSVCNTFWSLFLLAAICLRHSAFVSVRLALQSMSQGRYKARPSAYVWTRQLLRPIRDTTGILSRCFRKRADLRHYGEKHILHGATAMKL